MKRIYFAIASLALLFTGCQKDDETFRTPEEVSSFNQITVIPDGLADTRANINSAKQVVWEQGDTIAVYSDTDGIVPFVYSSGNTFTATKSVKGTLFFAYYPYSNNPYSPMFANKVEGNTLHLDVPGVRNQLHIYNKDLVLVETIKKDFIPMVGKSTTNEFTFKQTMGMLHFTVKDIATLSYIDVRGNDNEILSGHASINMTADSPVLTMEETTKGLWTNTRAQALFDDKALAAGEVVDVYIPVPVGTYAKGFTVDIYGYDADDEQITITKRTDKSLTVERAAMNSYTELDLYGEMEAELAKEKAALMAIYTAMNGENWYNKRNWNSDKPLYSWWGVGTNNNGFVTSIDLYGWNNMKGDIPAAIGDLPYLQRLYISGEGFTSLPKEIGKLDKVWILELAETGISELPDEIGDMRYLSSLYLSNNKNLKTLPKGIGRSLNINTLNLYDNAIETLPAEIANINSLRNVTIENNKFTKFPDALANSKSIINLSISEREMAGEIPVTIGNMTALNYLDIHSTQLSGPLPAALGSLPNLQTINLWGNQFEGTIPEAWGNAQNLNYLNVQGNKLSGEISASILNSKMWANVSTAYLNPQQNNVNLTFDGGEVPVTGLTLDKSSIVVYNTESAGVKLNVTTTPAITTEKNFNWNVENNVGYVDNGLFYANHVGKGKITVSKGENISASCDVEVRGVTFENNSMVLLSGESATIKPQIEGDDVSILRWVSENEKVATVDANGKVTAVGPGQTYIEAHISYPMGVGASLVSIAVANTTAEIESLTKEAEEGNWN